MSNVKRVEITGKLPFDCDTHHGMRGVLAQLNAPCCGIRIEWLGDAGYLHHGSGRTAMYSFKISGEEAVSNKWVETVLQAIVDCRGNYNSIRVLDVENGHAAQTINPPTPNNNVYYYTVEVRTPHTRLEREVVNIHVGEYMKSVIKTGTESNQPPTPIRETVIDHGQWSVRPA